MKNIDLQSNCLVVEGDNRLPFNMFEIVFRNCTTHEGYQQLIARFITWLRPSMQSEGMTLPNYKKPFDGMWLEKTVTVPWILISNISTFDFIT